MCIRQPKCIRKCVSSLKWKLNLLGLVFLCVSHLAMTVHISKATFRILRRKKLNNHQCIVIINYWQTEEDMNSWILTHSRVKEYVVHMQLSVQSTHTSMCQKQNEIEDIKLI